ncbi:F-box protein [Vigna angularis]|uniref:F-box protein n=1 Tax=Phaseolus angularis TaxID=3914 RepID=A0A8T0JH56_PHAAN|nr:F-box protein At2g27310-like [Vigna angularis]KAG2371571.1 F-box protein [Vigna angularis]
MDAASSFSSSDITTLHPDIIRSHILNRLDGPTLASASSATLHLRRLCTDHNLWRTICAASWPSLNQPHASSLIDTFPAAHRSVFSDSFPSIQYSPPPHPNPPQLPPEFLSIVDLYYKGKPVFSRVITTETHKGWFLSSPLWVELLDPNEVVPTPLIFAKCDEESSVPMPRSVTLANDGFVYGQPYGEDSFYFICSVFWNIILFVQFFGTEKTVRKKIYE